MIELIGYDLPFAIWFMRYESMDNGYFHPICDVSKAPSLEFEPFISSDLSNLWSAMTPNLLHLLWKGIWTPWHWWFLNVFDLSVDCQPLDIIRDFAGEEEYTDPEDHWNSRRPCHPWYPEGHKISGLCQSRKIMTRKYYQEFMACFRHQTVAKSSHSWHRVSKIRSFGMILESSQS